MFSVCICDDQESARQRLVHDLQLYAERKQVQLRITCFSSADELLLQYPQEPDLLLLDIGMEGTDGITAARRIRAFDEQVCIIFITTMVQLAIEGYQVRAFGFIRKPFLYDELEHEVSCALKQLSRRKDPGESLTVRENGILRRIPVRQIACCEVRNHTVLLYTDSGTLETRGQIGELEQKLAPYGFLRCHASFLVAPRYIA